MNALSKVAKDAEPVEFDKPARHLQPVPPSVTSVPEPATPPVQPEARPTAPAVQPPVQTESAAQAAPQATPVRKPRVRRYVIMAALPLLLLGGGGYYYATGGRYEETENANLRQARVAIASEASGRVVSVNAIDNAAVKQGDVLFTVEPEPFRIALAQADAALAAARLNVEQLRAGYRQAVAQQQSDQGDVAFLKDELQRQTSLSSKGINTRTALESARRDVAKAEDQERAASQAVAGALAALGGNAAIETDRHPAVMAALAARDNAAYALSQTTVRAPAAGVISQAGSFKVGQFVQAGSPLFTLVETDDIWVEANFKETQLTGMRLGQPAEVVLDTFPDRPMHGTVDSIGAGTGAEFSLLPAQNATGNWVKVTQRIPVRLKLEAVDEKLLRTGMSATVTVDTGHSRGLPWGLGKIVPSALAETLN